jgi:aerobic-type carbon monoxide dehydrogenase small subunit (CoxS/CutS family)
MRFTLNGHSAEIPNAMSEDRLLWVLRDRFALNGPRYGCGVASCGACSVHIDGQVELACMIAAKDVAGRSVVTLEGLGAGHADGLNPVQRAWIEASAAQCGYCQNGQVMTAAALLNENPAAGEAEVAAAMDGVVCRCGTQPRIREAIDRARALLEEGA